jgi:LytS/YehU family sensor histidine kinase
VTPSTRSRSDTPLRSFIRLLWVQPLVSVPFALFFGTLFGMTPRAYWISYKLSLVFAYCIGLSIWAVRAFIMPRMPGCEDRDTPRRQWQIALSFGAASVIGSYTAAFIIHNTILPGFMGSARNVVISGMYTVLFFGLFSGINFAIVFYRQAVERARAVEQARAELAQAELRALRAQINPHFLFNTLNSIASLIRENPDAAEDMTTRLAELFRYTLKGSEHDRVPLAQELAFVRGYLEIERTRFGDRLRVEESTEPGLDAVAVPSLLLQPVVENAVRHGVGARAEAGRVWLEARRDGEHLVLEVRDDGPGLDAAAATSDGTGFGLHSVRERLRALGPPHALDIDSGLERGTRVRITLPLHPPGSDASTPSRGDAP